ncbi:hypothetical protein [Gallaecimonas sp. GXIMD4217]|uniref:COG4648 family protein n=1 Tax=Gallaecimonas sp. GXIMD4217 TaxID=3131927 RepID=UPI00311ACB0B
MLKLLGVLALLAYPLLVWAGLQWLEPGWLALLLAVPVLLRFHGARGHHRYLMLAALGLLAWSLLSNQDWGIKLYPVAMNLGLLLVFAWSLHRPPSLIERLARLKEPELDQRGVAYTRQVTQIWCGFFVVNGLVALATVLAGDDELWALYNGLVSYALMGMLLGGEWLYRKLVLKV